MKFRPGLSMSPSTKMPTLVFTHSPIPMPKSQAQRILKSSVYSQRPSTASASPVYSQRPPMPTHRPHIMPIRKADMIPSLTPLPLPSQEHTLIISSLQAVGVFGVILFFAMILWAIRIEMSKASAKVKAKGFTYIDYPQQINPNAYNKLNLIRRSSSTSLSSGNISPV